MPKDDSVFLNRANPFGEAFARSGLVEMDKVPTALRLPRKAYPVSRIR